LNPAVRKKEATMVAGLARMTLGVVIAMLLEVAIATTRRRRRPSMMEAIVLVIIAAINTAQDIHVMTLNAW
jgi:hypothetical protein